MDGFRPVTFCDYRRFVLKEEGLLYSASTDANRLEKRSKSCLEDSVLILGLKRLQELKARQH